MLAKSLIFLLGISLSFCYTLDHPLSSFLYPEAFDYNPLIPPQNVRVKLQLYVRDVKRFPEDDEVDFQLTVRQFWNDPRLRFNSTSKEYITLVGDEGSQKIWFPDTFIQNSKTSKNYGLWRNNQYLRVFSNGDVKMSTRVGTKVNGNKYMTKLKFASYAYKKNEVAYEWALDPVKINEDIPRILSLNNVDSSEVTTATGTYSLLICSF